MSVRNGPKQIQFSFMAGRYEPKSFEDKWRARWKDADLFRTREDANRPKFYGLDFFPYPSGAGLSVGHCRNYIPTDVLCRMKYMQGYNVLHPMGFDAFGLPAENEAIAKQTHPEPMIRQYGENYRRQMDLVGISYDWSRQVYSSDPAYYKWTQWCFELLHKRGLAYRAMALVNWCPKDKTVLAAEEVEAGRCWRCQTPVEKKEIPQWYFRITAYADRLLDDLDKVDWPEGIKMLQRNWIGRSEGVEFDMKVVFESGADAGNDTDPSPAFTVVERERNLSIRVFTTRIDTIFGVTFCVIAPEHPIVDEILRHSSEGLRKKVEEYRNSASAMADIDRQALTREKTGVATGAIAVNPANGRHVPIFIADYVLMGYGTGAIMAVPGHDERDFEFANAHGLEVVPVIAHSDGSIGDLPYAAKDGVLVNSGEYSGLTVAEAQHSLGEWMEGLGIGQRVVNYRMRDWLISRQRYWGCPIPVVHSAEGEIELVPEANLPVELPMVDSYQPTSDGSSPLSAIPEFVNVTDSTGRLGRRETDTMGGFACSSWYFLRFCDPHNSDQAWNPDRAKYWMPVDCYVGGAEHAVMHLLYARFWTKVFFDEGLVSVDEPFQRLMNQGQVLALTPYRKPIGDEKLGVGEEGILISFEEATEVQAKIDRGELDPDFLFYRWARMSKSKGNVVTPDEMVDRFGADALRIYELFVAPFEADVQWSNDGISGSVRFLNRIFRLVEDVRPHFDQDWRVEIAKVELSTAAKAIRRSVHQAVKKVTSDVDRFAFNTAVAHLMTGLNSISDHMKGWEQDRSCILALSEAVESYILLLAPMTPFSADELWESIGKSGFTYNQPWPAFDPDIAKEDSVTIAIQVNGKLRDTIEVPAETGQSELQALALESEKVAQHVEGKSVRKVIVVPGKIVNIVAN